MPKTYLFDKQNLPFGVYSLKTTLNPQKTYPFRVGFCLLNLPTLGSVLSLEKQVLAYPFPLEEISVPLQTKAIKKRTKNGYKYLVSRVDIDKLKEEQKLDAAELLTIKEQKLDEPDIITPEEQDIPF